jgi:hypothetical protein
VTTAPGVNGNIPIPPSGISTNLNQRLNAGPSTQPNGSTNGGSASGIQQVDNINNSNGQIDLNNLPPPPPPPNILPPSPPPNLVPARED